MNKTPIQWTDRSWNPLLGCRRVSEGCRNCYAERLIATRLSKNPKLPMYHDIARLTGNGEPQFTGARKLLPDRLDAPLRVRKPQRVFPCDMGDLFFEGHPFEDIAAVFGVMAAAYWHTFQVLTKRPERAVAFFEWIGTSHIRQHDGFPPPTVLECMAWAQKVIGPDRCRAQRTSTWPLSNVWFGVSVEDQAAADDRIPKLLRIPAALRFLSCEPLLGPIVLDRMWTVGDIDVTPWSQHPTPTVGWVIAGGESGPRARPCDLAWLRSLRDQCKAAGVPFFAKQLGASPVDIVPSPFGGSSTGVIREAPAGREIALRYKDKHGGDMDEWPADLRVREFPKSTRAR